MGAEPHSIVSVQGCFGQELRGLGTTPQTIARGDFDLPYRPVASLCGSIHCLQLGSMTSTAANEPTSLDAAMTLLLHIGRHRPGAQWERASDASGVRVLLTISF